LCIRYTLQKGCEISDEDMALLDAIGIPPEDD